MSRMTNIITGLLGLTFVGVFVIGLSHSISSGFAGFWGGFPFMVIVILVLAMALFNFWEDAIKKDDND